MVIGEKTHLSGGQKRPIVDALVVRLAVFGIIVLVAFGALFSRLWFLQVLDVENYRALAKDNRVRFVYSEPNRGRILDRNGVVLVDNHKTLAVTIDRQIVDTAVEEGQTLGRLSGLLGIPIYELRERLYKTGLSPFKPVPVAYGVSERNDTYIRENAEDFPGVRAELLPIRRYPKGVTAAQILGYVAQISPEDLELDYFKNAEPAYEGGDIVGKLGIERTYDHWLRGRPAITKIVVNSSDNVVDTELKQEERNGRDLYLSLDIKVQKVVEEALASGIRAAQGAGFPAPTGSVVVMDPNTGGVLAMASYPTYDPTILADGISQKEFKLLGDPTEDPNDDAMLNRAIQAQRPPASTFKVVTAGAALATGVADTSTVIDCPGSAVYPPGENVVGQVRFRNWTTLDLGLMGFPESLEQSCDTFYYELGWRMEDLYGPKTNFTHGDGSDRFQDYARAAGFGHSTGIDLPYEKAGRVPDQEWCQAAFEATKDDPFPTCALGWLPGFAVNMAIGQGDVIATPLQMAVTYAAIANGGSVLKPRLGWTISDPVRPGSDEVKQFTPEAVGRLPLDAAEIEAMQLGLRRVTGGINGTARPAFAGFPLAEFPVAGKTGTAEVEGDETDSWFVGYGPADDPFYVVSVHVQAAGHGGETAAPITRQIFEALFGIDGSLDVSLSEDEST